METEMIDKLFLELSQVSKAKTRRELRLEAGIRNIVLTWKEYEEAEDGQAELDALKGWIEEADIRTREK